MNPSSPNSLSLHGVFIEVFNLGILLSGKSGIGKSELALSLVDRGHKLVADDSVCFIKANSSQLIGQCPELLQDFLEVRGLGILNIRQLYGEQAITIKKPLSLIVHIIQVDPATLYEIDRLNGMHQIKNILDVSIPEVTIPVAPGRNLAILVEAAVKNQLLKINGYNASTAFAERHKEYMQRE